ncbi:uncharacterized protein LOC143541195 [Bidens hawaiensis]|uniref:uncharacterized protein LOC143541195 n=1 Tax=Bidens hawaiensis TaxID=980011 RepID=UPI00404AB02C
MVVTSPPHGCIEKKHWWLTNKQIVDMHVKDARSLIASEEQSNIASAINLLDAALALSPRCEAALELKATALLHLRRFNEVADMLQDYIPSLKMTSDDSSSSSSTDNSNSRERVKLLSTDADSDARSEQSCTCFSVSDLKNKVMAGLAKNRHREGQWRYLILGQACCHLGLMEDAMALLQTGKRLASAAFRRESVCWSDDSFTFSGNQPQTYSESICHQVSHIKLLLRRKTAAIAAAEAGLHTESIRHFSKIVDGRRSVPQNFLAECYMQRAAAYKSAGRIAEAIADCNRTLSLDPSCIEVLHTRASLFEAINCLTDSLHDLEHLKLLHNSILRDRKLPGPVWKRQTVGYNEIPAKLRSISTKIENLKQRVASGEIGNVDYYALFGLRRGCSRSELERSHLLLTLRHKPDKSINFIDRCEFSDIGDADSVKERARMSGLLLFRLIQRGYTSMMRTVLDEQALDKPRKKMIHDEHVHQQISSKSVDMVTVRNNSNKRNEGETKNAIKGVFCRDLAVVGNLLSQTGFNRPIQVKYEGLSC